MHSAVVEEQQSSFFLAKDLQKGHFKIVGKFSKGFILVKIRNIVYIVDQHALHERVRLERLEELFEYLEQHDYCNLENFKNDQMNDKNGELPSQLDLEMVWKASQDKKNKGKRSDDHQHYYHHLTMALKSRACKGAIKISDAIDDKKIAGLLELLGFCKHPLICAHGRPTLVTLSLFTQGGGGVNLNGL